MRLRRLNVGAKNNTMEPTAHLNILIDLALHEDVGAGDLTSQALCSDTKHGTARFVAREPLVVSGLNVAAAVFARLDARCRFQFRAKEGSAVKSGATLAVVTGPLQVLLAGERTALNFIRHLSGVATLTRQYVQQLRGTRCRLLDTRKTTPGMRALEKAAVRAGGGSNHRMGLFDGVLIKDNHIAATGSIRRAVEAARKRIGPMTKVEVEAESLAQVRAALAAGADVIMLDNMKPALMVKAVGLVKGQAKLEASGRVTLKNVRAVAKTGVDFVSVGAITHSAPAVDIAMDLYGAA
jgi:nicotinate-nucleotide pyrophosphorylase (carboxylating)